jgi:probable HAF family extracellular repeat protein
MTHRAHLVAALCLAAVTSAEAAQYTLVSLGEYWNGVAINSAGQIVGNNTIYNRGLVYQAGEIRGLATLYGRPVTSGINGTGVIAGTDWSPNNVPRAARWITPDEPHDLGVLPGGTTSYATGINDAGHVVGASNYEPEGGRTYAVIWKKDKPKSLGSLPGSNNSGASAINAKGQVAGWATEAVTQNKHAVRWTLGTILDLGVLPGATHEYSYATAINRRGDVVGGATSSNGQLHPFLYRAAQTVPITDLGTLYGGENENCEATGINYAREIVGSCNDWVALKSGAFIYRRGKLQPLDKFLDSSGAGWHVYAAHSINDQGQILGAAYDPDGNWHPVLLTPTSVSR